MSSYQPATKQLIKQLKAAGAAYLTYAAAGKPQAKGFRVLEDGADIRLMVYSPSEVCRTQVATTIVRALQPLYRVEPLYWEGILAHIIVHDVLPQMPAFGLGPCDDCGWPLAAGMECPNCQNEIELNAALTPAEEVAAVSGALQMPSCLWEASESYDEDTRVNARLLLATLAEVGPQLLRRAAFKALASEYFRLTSEA